ncbi:hypothetical protein C8J57DRAFT_1494541 [Mycena rebaudengoi]|nr:hypothetical protein C8J57DRAFT_1494541 [Mycena rebaudengoi]
MSCLHTTLSFDPSTHASQAGYSRPTQRQRAAAAGAKLHPESKEKRKWNEGGPGPFSAPLILPGDDLALDPEYPPQSVEEWQTDDDRNAVKPDRNVLYVVAPPTADSEVSFVKSWATPAKKHTDSASATTPRTQDVADYLAAFYHGMPVKVLPSHTFCFMPWNEKVSKTPRYIGLKTSTECIRLRTRAYKDVFPRQLNLDDLLDAAISILPDDAFALLLLVNHDIYESPDDDFACGRAYGGSRVAVISTARYNPSLDRLHSVDRLHSWPASHCKAYMDSACADSPRPKKKLKGKVAASDPAGTGSVEPTNRATLSPLHAALAAHEPLPSPVESASAATLSALWLARACRTASHELGHCIGIDHCVYYACAMQGTASLAEDARQPLFLCPVDLAKMLRATGSGQEERYRAILAFCNKHPDNHLFVAFAAWIRAQLPDTTSKRLREDAE